MKVWKRALSVGLSLALCAGLAAPGFAATFTELQDAIDSGNSVYKDGYSADNRAEKDEDTYKIKVEAGKDDEGNDTRVVTLYEDVENARRPVLPATETPTGGPTETPTTTPYPPTEIPTGTPTDQPTDSAEPGIVIRESQNITLDLNGHDINMNPDWTAKIPTWESVDGDAEAWNTEPADFRDGAGNVIDGMWEYQSVLNQGSVISVEEGGKLTLEDSGAAWTGSLDFDSDPSSTSTPAPTVPKYTGGKITGAATEAGIKNEGTLVMNGGELSGNGWAAVNNSNGDFEMNGGVIRNNKCAVTAYQDNRITMNGGQISENFGGGGVIELWEGTFTMNNGVIAGNKTGVPVVRAQHYGVNGVYILGGTIYGNAIAGNHPTGDHTWAQVLCNLGTVTLPEGSEPASVNKTDGSIDFPAGTKIEQGNTEYVGVGDIHVDQNGNMTGEFVSKTENKDNSVTITGTTGTETQITDTNGGDVTLNPDGTTTVPEGGKVTGENGETTYPDGAIIDKDGNVTGEGVTKTENDDGTTTITGTTGTETQITDTNGGNVTVNPDGTADVPEGGKITDGEGNETTYPDGAIIDKDGNVTTEGGTVTKDGETGDVTITGKDENGNETETKVDVPEDKKDGVDVDSEGKTHVPGGSEQPVEVKKDGEEKGTEITAPEGKDIVVNPDGSVDVPEGGKVTDKDGNEYELPEGGKVTEDGKVVDKDGNPVAPKKDDSDKDNDNGGNGGSTGSITSIEEPEVPLAGIVTVEDVLEVLYRLAGDAEGETARDEVIAWAIENGIIDDEADAEEIVTVAILRDMLANYARAFELDVDVYALAALVGEDDDIVMNCDEVIGEFFAQDEEEDAA